MTEPDLGESIARLIENATPYLIAALPVLAKIVRRRSIHWRLRPWPTKALGLLVEILDFVHLPKLRPTEHDLTAAELEAQARRIEGRKGWRGIQKEVQKVRETGEFEKIGSKDGC